jgi:sulfur carrier protein
MKIMLNGQEKSFKAPLTVSALLQDMGLGERRVAVEVNRDIVPRSQHEGFQLQDNDRVEVVFAIGGGGMSREQGPHEVGMRPAANAAGYQQQGLSVSQKVFGGVVHGSNR